MQEQVGAFLDGLTSRTEEVKTRCRTKLQALAEVLTSDAAAQEGLAADHVVLTGASV